MIEVVHTHISTQKHLHTNITPSMSLAALRWILSTAIPSHRCPPRLALSLARCSAAGLEDLTQCVELLLKNNQSQPTLISCFFLCSLYFNCLTRSEHSGTVSFEFTSVLFFPQYRDKFVIVNAIALAHLSTPPDSVTQFI